MIIKRYYRKGYYICDIFGIRFKISKQNNLLKKYKIKNKEYSKRKSNNASVALNLVGDLMCETYCQQACIYDDKYFFKDCFSIVKPVLQDADFVIGNLESTISENHPYMGKESKLNGNYNCNSPVEFLDAVKYAGFNVLIAANNHNLDAQKQGHFDTIRHIEEFDFQYTGIFKDKKQERYLILEKNGIKIGLLSYYTVHNKIKHDFSDDDINVFFNRYSKDKVIDDVKELRNNGADYIITYIHWGIERVHTITSYQQKTAKEMAEAGVDYIIGSHPHALQPYEELNVNNKKVPVIYSLGNFLSSSRLGQCTRDTIILQLELKKQNNKCSLVKNTYIPCQIFDYFEGRNYPIIPLIDKFNGGIGSPLFKKSILRIKKVLGNTLEINK
jgi:poly-gamma-glutamate synthesis protein (capsule biosynthesis protein)